jgi:hypothetical protein
MTSSYADHHDRDKLTRWYRDLSSGPSGRFPVYAIFLVSERDRDAHDIFRQFRASFEARGAAFDRLVIFGQHGISSTARALLAEFKGGEEATLTPPLPVLVLVVRPSAITAYTLPLPAGHGSVAGNGGGGDWQNVLTRVERAADQGDEGLELATVSQLTACQLGGGSLVGLVGRVLNRLDGSPPTSRTV